MKPATIFVVALTVFSTIFLESSALPAPSDDKCALLNERITTSNKALDEMNDASSAAWDVANYEQKEEQTDVAVSLMGYNDIVPKIHSSLQKLVCSGGSDQDRDDVCAEMNSVAKQMKSILADLPNKSIPVVYKAVLVNGITVIIGNAAAVGEDIGCSSA